MHNAQGGYESPLQTGKGDLDGLFFQNPGQQRHGLTGI